MKIDADQIERRAFHLRMEELSSTPEQLRENPERILHALDHLQGVVDESGEQILDAIVLLAPKLTTAAFISDKVAWHAALQEARDAIAFLKSDDDTANEIMVLTNASDDAWSAWAEIVCATARMMGQP